MAGRKFGEFGKFSVIRQTKTIQINTTIDNLLAGLFTCQTFFAKCSDRANLPNFPAIWYTVILLAGNFFIGSGVCLHYEETKLQSDRKVELTSGNVSGG